MKPIFVYISTLILGISLLFSVGCVGKATFPKAQLSDTIQELLTAEGLDVSVRVMDETVAIHISAEGALEQGAAQVTLGPKFDELIRSGLTVLHRVLLSTDANIQFYIVLMSDPKVKGIHLTMIRYIDDIKRSNVNKITTTEMFSRTIFDLNQTTTEPILLEQYVPRDIDLNEFLGWQIARRIQNAMNVQSKDLDQEIQVGRCAGEFMNGEFIFVLNVSTPSQEYLTEETMQGLFRISTEEIAKVLSSYEFESFDAIRLIHPPTGRNLFLPRLGLKTFQ